MKKWGVLVLMAMSMFIIVIDTTIMNVSISNLVVDLNTTVGGIQAAISIYALVMASLILIGGSLANRYGKKRIFVIGLIIFGIGTTTASFANSLGVLIIGWSILEGIGSAFMLPNIQTILRGEYEGAERATAYGMVSAVAAAGAAIGPIVGGLLTTYASWRWAFRLEVIIVITVLVLNRYIQKDTLPERVPKFDFVGALLSIFGWSSIVLGVLGIQQYGLWIAKQPLVIGSLEIAPFGLSIVPFLIGAGVLLILCLLRWEENRAEAGKDGLFRRDLFRLQGLSSSFGVRFVQMAIMAAFLFLVPLLFQLTFAFSAIQTGLALMPYSLGVLIFALIGARLSKRYPAKRIIQAGYITGIIGLIMLAVTVQPDATPADLALGGVFGIGMGLVASQILNLILSSGTETDTAEIAGLNGTFEQLGNSLGVALLGAIMLVTLTIGMSDAIRASPVIPAEIQEDVITAVETNIALVSNDTLEAGLDAAGADEAVEEELINIYAEQRTFAFKSGIIFLIFVALGGLIGTTGLANRKLVAESEDTAASGVISAG